MELKLYDTLTREKRPFRPLDPARVRMYVCGPTVYDFAHIGNARPVIVFDVLFRLLRHLYGADHVTYVRNITDVDDKIIARAAEEYPDLPLNEAIRRVTETTDKQFHEDVTALGCLPPTHEPRATEHIALMLDLSRTLVAQGVAYPTPDGSVYFRVRRFAGYGKLSHRRLEDMEVGEEIDPAKEDPHDFALWKGAKPGEPTWESPWGPGRPGWHLECSAMSAHYLGQPFDVHGGGSDLVFPHHENEIAQSEAVASVPLADLWVHNGMITFGSDKMSKSLGNVLSIADATDRVPGEALRLLFYGTHYRAPLDFGPGRLEEAARSLERLYEALARADDLAGRSLAPIPPAGALTGPLSPFLEEFAAAMDDDLNAAKALGLVFDRLRELNRTCDAADRSAALAARDDLTRAGAVLGLFAEAPAAFLDAARSRGQRRAGLTTAEIEAAIAARNDARHRKDFRAADTIRERLREQGILLEDAPTGTVWRAG